MIGPLRTRKEEISNFWDIVYNLWASTIYCYYVGESQNFLERWDVWCSLFISSRSLQQTVVMDKSTSKPTTVWGYFFVMKRILLSVDKWWRNIMDNLYSILLYDQNSQSKHQSLWPLLPPLQTQLEPWGFWRSTALNWGSQRSCSSKLPFREWWEFSKATCLKLSLVSQWNTTSQSHIVMVLYCVCYYRQKHI